MTRQTRLMITTYISVKAYWDGGYYKSSLSGMKLKIKRVKSPVNPEVITLSSGT